MGEFIRLYTTRYDRWLSPKFLAGESYGTFRAIGLADTLYESYGMEVNGLVLISLAIDFQGFSFNLGNDLPYLLFLPTYACSAWYHKKLDSDLQQDFDKVGKEAEAWALQEYAGVLLEGDAVPVERKEKTIEGLRRFTGLQKGLIENSNLRVNRYAFMHELLRSEDRSLGLMDRPEGPQGQGRRVFERSRRWSRPLRRTSRS